MAVESDTKVGAKTNVHDDWKLIFLDAHPNIRFRITAELSQEIHAISST